MLMLETFVIGIPSFFLAFLPNDEPVKGKFLTNLVKNSLPGALTFIINTVAVYVFCLLVDGSVSGDLVIPIITTMLTISITVSGLVFLLRLCKPLNTYKTVLCILMFLICFVFMLAMPGFFGICTLDLSHTLFTIILVLLAPTVINAMFAISDKIKF